jgi:deoxyribodipyrimidine photolyase
LPAADREALGLFVPDKRLINPSGAARLAFLYRCLRDLDEQLDGRLLVVSGDPVELPDRQASRGFERARIRRRCPVRPGAGRERQESTGEQAALDAWAEFRDERLEDYHERREREVALARYDAIKQS